MQKLKLGNIVPLLFLLLAVLVVFGLRDAHATKPKPPPTPAPTAEARANAVADASATSSAEAAATANQSQTATADNDGNLQTVTFTSPDDVTIRNVASANPPSVYGSHPCATGGSAGIGIPAVNISGGRQKIDPDCVEREEARLLHAFGERELAVMHLCNTSEALQASLGEACGPSITQEELLRRIDFINNERAIERANCKESIDRCTSDWEESQGK